MVVLGLVLVVFIFRYRITSQKLIRKQEQQLFINEKEKLEQEKELQSTKAYIDGQEKEKNRIALELHDGIVGDLVGLQHFVNTPNFETNTTYQEKTKEKLTQIAGEVRYLSHSLSSSYVDNTPFTKLVYKLVQPFTTSKTLDISIHFFEEKDFKHLNSTLKNNLYRIVQQLLDNSLKHAKASEINLSFIAHENNYNLIFEDNGIGFDINKKHSGIGLLNIEKRVKDLKGNLQIDSQFNRGTTIIIDIERNE